MFNVLNRSALKEQTLKIFFLNYSQVKNYFGKVFVLTSLTV
jgi:hypothetical protein